MSEFTCTDCRAPAKKAYLGVTRHDGYAEEALFLYCERHPAPLWITMNADFKEVDLDTLRVSTVMES